MKKVAFILSIILCLSLGTNTLALVEKPKNILQVDLAALDTALQFDAYIPSNALVIKITDIKPFNDTRVLCSYKLESTLRADEKRMPKLEILGTNVKKGERYVIILYDRHISYWQKSYYMNCTKLKLEDNHVILSPTENMPLEELMAWLSTLDKPSKANLAEQVKDAALILEGKVSHVTGDGSADYAFASIKPIKVYKGVLPLDKDIEVNVYRQLKKGKTYIFFLKEGISDLPGDSPALVAVDKEASFALASSRLRKDIQKELAAQ